MSKEHHAASYADRAWHGTVTIEDKLVVAKDTHRIRFPCPEIARQLLPGQFIMLRIPGSASPLLGRPLAVFDVIRDKQGRPQGLDLVYLAVGKMTRRLATMEPGQKLEVWGPLGNGFPPVEADHLIMIAGGIGQTPFLTLAQECLGLRSYGDPPRQVPRVKQVTLCYGARSHEYLACVGDFRRSGIAMHVSTDDGSAGHHGLVSDLIEPLVEETNGSCRIVCCGPEPMMEAVAVIARRLGVPCQVSLETPMACGIGICFSCVAKVRGPDGTWDYRRTCVEGPVFDAEKIEF